MKKQACPSGATLRFIILERLPGSDGHGIVLGSHYVDAVILPYEVERRARN